MAAFYSSQREGLTGKRGSCVCMYIYVSICVCCMGLIAIRMLCWVLESGGPWGLPSAGAGEPTALGCLGSALRPSSKHLSGAGWCGHLWAQARVETGGSAWLWAQEGRLRGTAGKDLAPHTLLCPSWEPDKVCNACGIHSQRKTWCTWLPSVRSNRTSF